MNRLLLLALPLLLTACPARQATTDAATDAATPATPAPVEAAATAPAPAAPDSEAPDLVATLPRFHWRLQDASDAAGKRIDALFARDDLPVRLDFADGRVSISNTCNRMAGSYTMSAGTLTIERLASTRMACVDPRLMALDGEVGKRLQGASTLSLAGGDTPALTLTNAAGDTLAFTGQPTANTRFGGPSQRVFLEVAAQTKPCSHPLIPNMQCLQVREIHYDDKGLKVGTPGKFENFFGEIEGYTHEPGVRNVLRLNRYTRKDVPADASKYAYVLDMAVESDGSGK